MAATVTGSASSGRTSGSTTSLTVSHTANGDDLFVWVGIYGALDKPWPTCTYNGVALDRVFSDRELTLAGVYLFRMPSAAAGTANIVATFLAGNYITLGAFNVNGAGGIRATRGATGSNTTPTVTVPSVAGDLVLDFCQSDAANQDWTVGAGQTLIYEIVDATSNEKSAASYESAVGTTTVMSYTLSVSNGWTLFACSVTGASGGGASNVPFVG